MNADLMRATLALMGWTPLRDTNCSANTWLGWEAISNGLALWSDGIAYRLMSGRAVGVRFQDNARFRPAAWADVPDDVVSDIYDAIRTHELKP